MGILSLVAQYVLSAPMAPVGCQSMTCCAHLFMFHCPCDDCKLLRLFWWRHRHPGVFLGLPAHSWWCEGVGCSLGGIGGNRVKGRDGGETGQTWGSVFTQKWCRSCGMKVWGKDWSGLCIRKWNHR